MLMVAKIIDGKKISKEIIESVAKQVLEINVKPGLAVILVGNNSASDVYVRNKEKASIKAGFDSRLVRFDETVSEEKLLEVIDEMNNDPKIHGFIVQLPLPKHISQKKIINAISPLKDADGFTTTNLGNLFVGKKTIPPATAVAVITMIESVEKDVRGKNVVIVGASNIVGKPLAVLLLNKFATVTICNIDTKNLSKHTKHADILIVAAGKANLITKEMVKEGSIIIDVGINKVDGKLCGDVAKDVSEIAGYVSPVPGGVGPMTVAMLLKNTLECMKLQGVF